MSIEELEKIAENNLSEKRFKHSQNVKKRCRELALIYNIDVEMAEKVGIMHDIAKEMTDEDKIKYIIKNGIFIDEVESRHTGLLHAKIGANIAEKEYGFTRQMAEAIACHTTGKPKMDILAKILFVADATGEERNWDGVEEIRVLSETNLDEAILCILDINIKKNIDKGNLIHTDSIYTRNMLIEQLHKTQKIG